MGERKVLNKYYPPDFDPTAIPKRKMPKDRQYKVRLMAPFNMRCVNCGEYIYKGKKFNAMKETVLDEDYLGLHIFRFYIRCTLCACEIVFKTDPANTDYAMETGATRNFENWRVATVDPEEEAAAAAELEEQNPMAALENRTEETKREMDILDGLEEIKDANARKFNVDIETVIAAKQAAKDEILAARRKAKADKLMAEENALVAAAFGEEKVKRLQSSDEEDDEGGGAAAEMPAPAAAAAAAVRKRGLAADKPDPKRARKEPSVGGLGGGALAGLVKRKAAGKGVGAGGAAAAVAAAAVVKAKAVAAVAAASAPKPAAAGLGGLLDYSSSGSSSDGS